MLPPNIFISPKIAGVKRFNTSARAIQKEIIMNRYSRTITQPKAQGASQVSIPALRTRLTLFRPCCTQQMVLIMIRILTKPWWALPVSGTRVIRAYQLRWTSLIVRCNRHILGLGQRVKKSLVEAGIIGYQFGTVGVSDGISMVSYSLQSRDLIADSVETAAGGHWLDGMVVIPGCDKNMPGTLIALGRLNRPGMMVYGGTIRPGYCRGETLDIVSAFQSYGRYLQEGQTPEAEKRRYDTVRNACPGSGACGGSLTMALGGSTNAVLHLIAIAKSVGINLTIDDFQAVSDRVPLLADLKPSGKYVMEDVNTIGGTPSVIHYLIKNDIMTGDELTITGKTLGENCDRWVEKHGSKWEGQKILRPISDPIKILRGNLAPGGAVSKITGKEGLQFTGKCRAFDDEESFVKAVENGSIKKGEKTVVVLRYLGPKGGPVGGPIALVRDGDIIFIDAVANTLEVDISDEEMLTRKAKWTAPPLKHSQGTLFKYAQAVTDASNGCVTDA
ncbi:uncharacterized protein L203_105756 [Cryptococcus depauperatus CBS 7841]|uniref:Dihydroxy-acid dehydratase n=1 Tax=Cryptococcus depauperatus CBS 7841 TaxID=1295531 RepID=A0AAJ8M2V6_9TREE